MRNRMAWQLQIVSVCHMLMAASNIWYTLLPVPRNVKIKKDYLIIKANLGIMSILN